jgi:hypothetical protein
MPPTLRLVRCDNRTPLLLTLHDEHGNEIARATTPSNEAVRCAILLLAQTQTLRPGHRLTVAMGATGRAGPILTQGRPSSRAPFLFVAQ